MKSSASLLMISVSMVLTINHVNGGRPRELHQYSYTHGPPSSLVNTSLTVKKYSPLANGIALLDTYSKNSTNDTVITPSSEVPTSTQAGHRSMRSREDLKRLWNSDTGVIYKTLAGPTKLKLHRRRVHNVNSKGDDDNDDDDDNKYYRHNTSQELLLGCGYEDEVPCIGASFLRHDLHPITHNFPLGQNNVEHAVGMLVDPEALRSYIRSMSVTDLSWTRLANDVDAEDELLHDFARDAKSYWCIPADAVPGQNATYEVFWNEDWDRVEAWVGEKGDRWTNLYVNPLGGKGAVNYEMMAHQCVFGFPDYLVHHEGWGTEMANKSWSAFIGALHNFYELAYQYASSAPKEEGDEDHSLGVIGDSGYNNYIDGGSTRINNVIFMVFDSSEEMMGPIYDGLLGITVQTTPCKTHLGFSEEARWFCTDYYSSEEEEAHNILLAKVGACRMAKTMKENGGFDRVPVYETAFLTNAIVDVPAWTAIKEEGKTNIDKFIWEYDCCQKEMWDFAGNMSWYGC